MVAPFGASTRLLGRHPRPLAWHIRAITALAVAFVVVGAGLRLGGFG
ncbi:MAG: hypothetical protein VKP63_06905 [Cyanobacteriota bacterium]|nr:hypothetical protein [Cyanobacteriota bacterium]